MFRYLSSVRFAILLLALALVAVAAGTIVESVTDSHRQAALLVYSNPAFLLLLAAFFVNILLSALRRWPWRRPHLPFLLAHLGLLMVISGTAVKSIVGLQGNMLLYVDTASNHVLLPGTHALSIDGTVLPLKETLQLNGITVELLELSPHSSQQLQLWIKDGFAQIEDLPPLPLGQSLQVVLPGGKQWTLSARHVEAFEDLVPTTRPEIVVAGDAKGNSYICAYDDEEQMIRYPHDKPHSIFAVHEGRGGYVVQAAIAGTELYAPVSRRIEALPSLRKLEDNRPRATIRLTENGHSQIIQLTYDPTASALAWPALGHLLRFQPQTKPIPYTIHLHDASQENYPGTDQPKSYCATVSVNEKRTQLAMNRVHQTWDGYRFYLGNLTPNGESIQLVINRDPAKYLFTYPGGVLVGLGTLLLYRKRGRRDRQ